MQTPSGCSRWRGPRGWAGLDPETGPRRAHASETQRAGGSIPPRSGYRRSVRGRVCPGPAACSPRSCHKAAPWEGPRGQCRDFGDHTGPSERRQEVHLSGVDYPGKGRMGSFWGPLRLEGKLRPRIVPSSTFVQFSRQLQHGRISGFRVQLSSWLRPAEGPAARQASF